MKQLKFQTGEFKLARSFGGDLLKKAKNRTARPLSTKKSMHIVLRSEHAKGEWSFKTRRNRQIVAQATEKAAQKFGVKIYKFASGGNHLHLLVKLGNRFAYRGFIRALTGTIALQITAANKYKKIGKKFWSGRPFSRIVEWGSAFRLALDYVMLNQLEAAGVFPYQRGRLRDVKLHFEDK